MEVANAAQNLIQSVYQGSLAQFNHFHLRNQSVEDQYICALLVNSRIAPLLHFFQSLDLHAFAQQHAIAGEIEFHCQY